MKEIAEITAWLEENRSEKNRVGMLRFGITADMAYGVPVPLLRAKAKQYKGKHDVALELWNRNIHEARIIAGLIADPKQLTPQTMDAWAEGFDSWDVCDQCCLNLFRHVPYVYDKILSYAADQREFVRRTAFVLVAVLAVHDEKSSDELFISYLDLIEVCANDDRNFVKKAVNWALRQIGKRSLSLNAPAVEVARELSKSADTTARWIGKDALRELTAEKTITFIEKHRV